VTTDSNERAYLTATPSESLAVRAALDRRRAEALALELRGWIKNLGIPDASVQVSMVSATPEPATPANC
jgi:hypothetical protein